MISDDRAHKALVYLAESDEDAAALFADMEREEERTKQVKAAIFLVQSGTIPEREARAINSHEYQMALNAFYDAVRGYKAVANKRSTEELVVRAWQTVSSNRRQGNV